MNLWDVLTAMLGQAPVTAAAVAVLYVLISREVRSEVRKLERRMERLEEELGALERRAGRLEEEVRQVREKAGGLEEEARQMKQRIEQVEDQLELFGRVFLVYNSTLLRVLTAKDVLSKAEAEALTGHLLYAPLAKSKYYAEEVRQRLIEILKMVKERKYTAEDVRELMRISKLIEKEWRDASERPHGVLHKAGDAHRHDREIDSPGQVETRVELRRVVELTGVCQGGPTAEASRRPSRGPQPPGVLRRVFKN